MTHADALTAALTVISQDDEEGVSYDTVLDMLDCLATLAVAGLLWRCEFYTRTRRCYLEVAYSIPAPGGRRIGHREGDIRYRRHWAWLPSKPGTTMLQCTPLESASRADSGGAGADEAPAEGVACDAGSRVDLT